MDLHDDLTHLLNAHSRDNESNTPDFILADYMMRCLVAFEVAVGLREQWYGHGHEPGRTDGPDVPLDELPKRQLLDGSIVEPE